MSPRCLCRAHEAARAERAASLPRWLSWWARLGNPSPSRHANRPVQG